jgi:asparagine synthase (glutamine-hydrolysing)
MGLLVGAGTFAPQLRRKSPYGLEISEMYEDAEVALVSLVRARASRSRRPASAILPQGMSGQVTLLGGAIYNLGEIAAELAIHPTTPAALIVDRLIEERGPAGLARLDGDYVIARWSPESRTLFLASCPMGRASLCYAQTVDGIVAASSPSWLLAFPDVDAEPDTDALAMRLAKMESRVGDRTPWRAIRRLQPGQWLEWRRGSVRAGRFWSPEPRTTLRLRRDEDYVEAAREHLDRAVAARCPSGTPVLSLLSAGLDSTAMVAAAARQHDAPVHTLTVRPDPNVPLLEPGPHHFGGEWDRLQPFLARYPQLRPHVRDARQPGLDLEYPGGPLQSRDWPFKRPYQVAWLGLPLTDLMREQGLSVLLSADAGNATMSYTGAYVVADQLKQGRLSAAWDNLVVPDRGWHARPRALWRQGIMPFFPRLQRFQRRLRGQSDYWWQEWSSIREDVALRLQFEEHDVPQWNTGSPDLDRQLELVDRFRNGMAQYAHFTQGQDWSWRDPYADLALVEFCLSLPRDQYRRAGVTRLLARRALADRAPASIYEERRIGLQHSDWYGWMSLRRDWMAAEIDRIEQSTLASSVIDTQKMRAILDAWPATPDEASRFPTSHRLRNGLGDALRVGQFMLMQEGSNA